MQLSHPPLGLSSFHRFLCLLCLLLSGTALKAQYATEMTVAQDGSGDYRSIQAAIDNAKAFPDKRITIFIKRFFRLYL